MKDRKQLAAIFLLFFCAMPAFAQLINDSIANEARLVEAAEREVMIELVQATSPSIRGAGGELELAIGLIGMGQSEPSSDALINLLGLRLDGAGSEERTCQFLVRGKSLLLRLKYVEPTQVVKHCQIQFWKFRKRELLHVKDVEVSDVCASEEEISRARNELARAIKSGTPCHE